MSAASGPHPVVIDNGLPVATPPLSPEIQGLLAVALATLPPWARNTFAAGVLALGPLVYGAFVTIPSMQAQLKEQSASIERLSNEVQTLRGEVLQAIKGSR